MDNYSEIIPLVLFLLGEYLREKDRLINHERVFRLNGNLDTLYNLRLNLTLGNYKILTEPEWDKAQHEIATFFKEILLEMIDPVIPFVQYQNFVNIASKELPDLQKCEALAYYLQDSIGFSDYKVNIDTLFFVARICKTVADNDEKTLLPAESMGLLLGPMIVRPTKLTNKELKD